MNWQRLTMLIVGGYIAVVFAEIRFSAGWFSFGVALMFAASAGSIRVAIEDLTCTLNKFYELTRRNQ